MRPIVGSIAAALLLALAACAPEPDLAGCAPADPAVVAAIQARVPKGTLVSGGMATGKDGKVFVSAGLDRPGDDSKDELLTWLAVGGDYRSVDELAQKYSDWPDADINVKADGARKSRACAASYRSATTTTAG
jgi:hypothetical protein